MNGAIKTLAVDRGFGFVRGDVGRDYFFHQTDLRGGLVLADLNKGQRVAFEPRQADKGPRAADITPA